MKRVSVLVLAALLAGGIAPMPLFAQGAPQAGGESPRAAAFVEKFRAANTSHDGKLTLQQAQDGNMPFVAKNFSKIDVNNNGYVTLRDIGAFAQRMKAQNGGG